MKIQNIVLKRLIIFFCAFISIFIILFTSLINKKYDLKIGDIAKVDIKAPREVENKIASDNLIKEAQKSVDPQYYQKVEVLKAAIDNIDGIFDKVKNSKAETGDSKTILNNLITSLPSSYSSNEVQILLNLKEEDLSELNIIMDRTMTKVYEGNIRENNADDVKKSEETIIVEINNTKFPKEIRDLALKICKNQIQPNFFYDSDKTEALKEEIAKKTSPIMIKKDQIVVKEGEPVTAEQIKILDDLGLLYSKTTANWYIYINLAVLVIIIFIFQWIYLEKFNKEIYNNMKYMILICILNAISILMARTLNSIPFIIPFACVPMLMTLLINYEVALTINFLNVVLISSVVGFNIEVTLVALISAVLSPILLKKMQQRNDILYTSVYIAVISAIVTFNVGFLLSNNIWIILKKAGFSFIGGCISGILTIGFLPFFESAFDIVTTIKLLELSNPNNPLLKKLLLEAPGTYHHSILVANLSEMAAEKIGANPVLARVSAYYHDIGKIKRPYFFKENQILNENPHSKITPNLSSLIIISHVKDGLELARENKIPTVIQDAIEQHHGTDLVKYFYITMKNSSLNPDEVKEENFRYPGPIPNSKEIAILMLADGVEAAVRSIPEPTKGKIEEMVNNIIKARLNEGQLDNCDLTLKDLDLIRQAFLKALAGIYHQRIEYPTDKWAAKAIEKQGE